MKLLVTGGLGFIGSNFIIHVLKNYNDFEIINLDAEVDGSNHDNLKELEKSERYRFVKGNITNRKLLDELIPQVDCVINFAAESHVDRSIADPNPFLISNFRGVFTILEALIIFSILPTEVPPNLITILFIKLKYDIYLVYYLIINTLNYKDAQV